MDVASSRLGNAGSHVQQVWQEINKPEDQVAKEAQTQVEKADEQVGVTVYHAKFC